MKNPRESSKAAGAFTLIEIMIVVALMGIVLAMGIPSIARVLQKEGIRKAVSDVVEAFSTARSQAILSGTPTEVIIDPANRTFKVVLFALKDPNNLDENQKAASLFTATLPEDIGLDGVFVNYREISLGDEEAHIKFYPNGTADQCAVVIHSPSREVKKIMVDIVTGRAEMVADE
ncbi:MAG: hypothetical protein JWN25_3533 [Verrucomicrobiales bacterium]|nr:hypothetical protein [Verrucomicrobiales bacterium]